METAFDCDRIIIRSLDAYESEYIFHEKSKDYFQKENFQLSMTNKSKAHESLKIAAHWATLYIAFCKD